MQKLTNSRLNLYHLFIIRMPILGFLFFISCFSRGRLALLCHGANINRETDLKYATFGQLSVSKLNKKICTQFSLFSSQMCALTSLFTRDSFIF